MADTDEIPVARGLLATWALQMEGAATLLLAELPHLGLSIAEPLHRSAGQIALLACRKLPDEQGDER